MSANPPNVVYDCNVYVQALINRNGPAGVCITRVLRGDALLFVSEQLLAEVRETPDKPTPARLGVTVARTETLIENVLKVAVVVPIVPAVFIYDRDPDDAHYVNLALAAQANLIVSRDRDLLDLMDQGREAGAAFIARFPGLRILDPVQFLRELDEALNN